jgi:hypothetical protein
MIIKIEPLIRDKKLIQIKVSYGWDNNKNYYRYSIIFMDSLLLLLTSLDKLSKSFLKDNHELQKETAIGKYLQNKNQEEINTKLEDTDFINKFKIYCYKIVFLYGILLINLII